MAETASDKDERSFLTKVYDTTIRPLTSMSFRTVRLLFQCEQRISLTLVFLHSILPPCLSTHLLLDLTLYPLFFLAHVTPSALRIHNS